MSTYLREGQKSANLFCCVLMLTVNHHAIPSQTLLEVDETTEQFISVFIFNIFINKSSHQNKDMISVFGIRVENQSGKSVK